MYIKNKKQIYIYQCRFNIAKYNSHVACKFNNLFLGSIYWLTYSNLVRRDYKLPEQWYD